MTSRQRAQELIEAGKVVVAGAPALKPSRLVGSGEAITLVAAPSPFVGRGGLKLEAALERYGIDVTGKRAVDAGSSTGGFTDCLLQRGAAEVVAIDVGYGQLHERLRADPRVRVLERTDIRDATPALVGGKASVIVADLSFISLRRVLRSLFALADDRALLVLLVKPQFEAGKAEADRGRGIIRDPAVWRRVLHDVIAALGDHGAAIIGCMASPITGAEGNVEFLVVARAPSDDRPGSAGGVSRDVSPLIEVAIEEGQALTRMQAGD